jgi:predicted DNA binding CopG/RHH family protein
VKIKLIKVLLLLLLLTLVVGCQTLYMEKNSNALSEGVYAADESMTANRFDLAKKYVQQIKRLVLPPKKKLKVESVISRDGTRKYVILPKETEGQVVVVGSKEYDTLLKTKELASKITNSYTALEKYNKNIEDQLKKEKDITNKLIKENQELTVALEEKDKVIWKYIAIIIAESGLILFWFAWKLKFLFV